MRSAQSLIASTSDRDRAAIEAFAAVRRALNNYGGYRYLPTHAYAAFDARSKRAIAAAGGLRLISLSAGPAYARVKQRFIRAYGEASTRHLQTLSSSCGPAFALPVGDRE